MKTEDLIKLSMSITQGDWKLCDTDLVTASHDERTDHVAWIARRLETIPNAAAIALVPQLLSEVVTLRNALKGLLAIEDVRFWLPNNGLADGVELTDLTAARAALANDK